MSVRSPVVGAIGFFFFFGGALRDAVQVDEFFENLFGLLPFVVDQEGFVFGIDCVVIFVEIGFGAVIGSEMRAGVFVIWEMDEEGFDDLRQGLFFF